MEASLLARPLAFEVGEHVYLTTPVLLATPNDGQIEEYAFASAVRSKAPNENIGWLAGRYVEADRANLNGAMWLSDELALKSLTPMLCPVTVMHDPRTAVGCIADTKLFQESGATRIDTVLGVWRHRFADVWDEAAANIEKGQLAQSMECYTPWYTCSVCEQSYVKLPGGAERASWCSHLRGDSSPAGRRILRDTCFTGTGLIFGSRGGLPAYTDANLDHFQSEVAEYHERTHHDSTYRPQRSASHMALVQIEESELATLRRERDEAKANVDTLSNSNRELTGKAEVAEAAKLKAEGERDTEKAAKVALEEQAQAATLRDGRMGVLGTGFLARLGDISKSRLTELAAKCSDEEWDKELGEREEIAGVKRDAAATGATPPPEPRSGEQSGFKSEEVARFLGGGAAAPAAGGSAPPNGATSVRQLARAFGKPRTPAGAGK